MANGTSTASGLGTLADVSGILGVSGALVSAIGSFYSAKSAQLQARSQASSLQFQASIANLNARAAERDAQALLEAGQREKGLSTLRFGQIREESRARQAASGLQTGVGSAAEIQTSIEAAKEIDSLTIERNALRAASAARARGVDLLSRADLARVSAANLRRAAGIISPGLVLGTSLLGSAGQVASQFLQQSRFERLLRERGERDF